MQHFRNKALALLMALALVGPTACAEIERQTGLSSETQAGAGVGAAAGGIIAALAGADTGWIIAATLLGAVAGGLVGDYLTEEDQAMAGNSTVDALNSGGASEWQNPDSGNSGKVVVDNTFQNPAGTECRNFTQTINANGKTESQVGTACRAADGTWQVQT